MKPVLKWVGGKRQLISEIIKQMPNEYSRYIEPFVGGGALLFHLKPQRAIINDLNAELINVYRVIRDRVDDLIEDLRQHQNTKEYFMEIRSCDRSPDYWRMSDVARASRIIYLNKTCFNGLYRVNAKGHFNSSYGSYNNPCIVDEENLRSVSQYFRESGIEIKLGSYQWLFQCAVKDDFMYLDPPYDPVSESSSFVGYSQYGFTQTNQRELKHQVDTLTKKGVKVLLSNSATDFIKELWQDYSIVEVQAKRSVNCKATKRGAIAELLIRNY